MSLEVLQFEQDVCAHRHELRECTVLLKKSAESKIEQHATTGDADYTKLKEQKADMLIRQRAANWKTHAHLATCVHLVKTHHAKAQRILKAHRAFKKNVKSKINAGSPASDWNLPDFVDDDTSDSELEQDEFGRWRIPPAVGELEQDAD